MSVAHHLATHLRGIHTGGNWTERDVKQQLEGLDWRVAVREVPGSNSIATLAHHLKYFVGVQLQVLRGGPLEGHDRLSWETPAITSQQDWDGLIAEWLDQAAELANRVEQLTDEQLFGPFGDPKYGTTFSNLMGLVEHTHYHLGQIALVKKLIQLRSHDTA